MLNIVVPMAGRGQRFVEAGYTLPKPLVPVLGVPMIRLVLDNLRPACPHRFVFLCLQEHIEQHDLADQLRTWEPDGHILPVACITEGAACTVLLARDYIENDEPLMIANSDQWVDTDINAYIDVMQTQQADGLIMTMWADHPKWSYVGFDAQGRLDRVAEKQVISNEATVGIYNYRRGADFVRAAEAMIAKNLRVNNEFYVAPAYNELIGAGGKVIHVNVGKVGDGMYGLGLPEDLEAFVRLDIAQRATAPYRTERDRPVAEGQRLEIG